MAKLYNLARMTTATTGTGTITLGSAVSGYLTFALAGVVNGDIVDYAIKDGSNTEHGTGTYTSSGTTLTRSVTKSTNSNAAISLSGTAEVFISPRAETLNDAGLFTAGTLADARLSNVITAGGPTGSATVVPVITYDAHGRLTTVTTATIVPGKFLGRQTFFATNSAITPPAGATQAIVRMQAAGGGSGGVGAFGGQSGAGGGGSYLEGYVATLNGNFNYTLGAAGSAGASGNNAGGAASASNLAMTGITTFSAPGGLGGGGAASGSVGSVAAATAAPTLNSATTDWGVKGAASTSISLGACAGSFLIAGIAYLAPGIAFGGASAANLYGGGGPSKGGANVAGIAGGVGCLIIDWYS